MKLRMPTAVETIASPMKAAVFSTGHGVTGVEGVLFRRTPHR